MLWNNINFWRISAFALFAAALVLAYPNLGTGSRFILEDSGMEIVESPEHGALFRFTIHNKGESGDVRVDCNAYLYERGGDKRTDYILLGLEEGETKTGELFIPLPAGQSVHDWRIEVD